MVKDNIKINNSERDTRRVNRIRAYIKDKQEIFSREPVNQRDSGFLEALEQITFILKETK